MTRVQSDGQCECSKYLHCERQCNAWLDKRERCSVQRSTHLISLGYCINIYTICLTRYECFHSVLNIYDAGEYVVDISAAKSCLLSKRLLCFTWHLNVNVPKAMLRDLLNRRCHYYSAYRSTVFTLYGAQH